MGCDARRRSRASGREHRARTRAAGRRPTREGAGGRPDPRRQRRSCCGQVAEVASQVAWAASRRYRTIRTAGRSVDNEAHRWRGRAAADRAAQRRRRRHMCHRGPAAAHHRIAAPREKREGDSLARAAGDGAAFVAGRDEITRASGAGRGAARRNRARRTARRRGEQRADIARTRSRVAEAAGRRGRRSAARSRRGPGSSQELDQPAPAAHRLGERDSCERRTDRKCGRLACSAVGPVCRSTAARCSAERLRERMQPGPGRPASGAAQRSGTTRA